MYKITDDICQASYKITGCNFSKHTPFIKQYIILKKKNIDLIMLYRMGDFYELFYKDAIIASEILQINLTHKGYSANKKVIMAGIPHQSLNFYLKKLLNSGKSIVICEQMSNKNNVKKGLIKRKIVRIITPGTITDESLLPEKDDVFLAAIWEKKKNFGYSYLDINSGNFFISHHNNIDYILSEIERTDPKEILYPENFNFMSLIVQCSNIKERSILDFSYEESYYQLNKHFNTCNLDCFGISKKHIGLPAAGCLLKYVKNTQLNIIPQIRSIKINYFKNRIILNYATQKNLEITKSFSLNNKKNTLSYVLDYTKTPMGSRMLKRWLHSPLRNLNKVKKRQDAVEELIHLYDCLQPYLFKIGDLERIIGRFYLKTASPKDFIIMKNSLLQFIKIKKKLTNVNSYLLKKISKKIVIYDNLYKLIDKSITNYPSIKFGDGIIIADNYNKKLDYLRSVCTNNKEYLKYIEISEKKKINVNSLKIKFNNIIGYYIQINKKECSKISNKYKCIQTLKNVKRYTIKKLKNYEKNVLLSKSKLISLEKKLFNDLFDLIFPYLSSLKKICNYLSILDVLSSLAKKSHSLNYVRPKLTKKKTISIKKGRHPVIEKILKSPFISNSVNLSKKNRSLLITGPNMGGKSTYMRQTALIVIMAWVGSFVPAKHAEIGIIDQIFTRIGAIDDLSLGKSTFMMEMTETACILNNATKNSLVLIDEVGRGTSFIEGLSLACSCLEYLTNNIKSMNLFATHFLELTVLEKKMKFIKNIYFEAIKYNKKIIFTYKIKKGFSKNNYSINVASLAGLPNLIIKKSKKRLKKMKKINNSYLLKENIY
ncbi:DNA mismatch repair protein MutS [Buchnera aphidicola (Taiwanaphis decaspermi)]|uniref:DNA mismatch repair protein MutS n=1 Tax=Buchnera aphidicola TaxID=9 RepID=UPI0031B8A1F7